MSNPPDSWTARVEAMRTLGVTRMRWVDGMEIELGQPPTPAEPPAPEEKPRKKPAVLAPVRRRGAR